MPRLYSFFQFSDPAVDTPEAAASVGFAQDGCIGRGIYLVEHPSLLPLALHPTVDSSALKSPVFSCLADLGVIGKGRLFEHGQGLTTSLLRKFGADSLLIPGSPQDSASPVGSSGHSVVDDEDEAASGGAHAHRRFFVTLDAARITSVALWSSCQPVPTERLARLPAETLFTLVRKSEVAPQGVSLRSCGTSWCPVDDDGIVNAAPRLCWETRALVAQRVWKLLLASAATEWGASGGATVAHASSLHDALLRICGDWVVIAVSLSIGMVATLSSSLAAMDDTGADTVVLPVRTTELPEAAISASMWDLTVVEAILQCAVAQCTAVAKQGSRSAHRSDVAPPSTSAPAPPGTASASLLPPARQKLPLSATTLSMPQCVAGFRVTMVRSWAAQLRVFARELPSPHRATAWHLLEFLTMVSPECGRHDEPLYLVMNHCFALLKKKNVKRMVEHAGFSVAAPPTAVQAAATAYTGTTPCALASPLAAPSSSTDLHANERLPLPKAQSDRVATTIPTNPAVASESRRTLLILWDVDTMTPRVADAQLRSLLRMLSLHDLYDACNTVVDLRLFFRSANLRASTVDALASVHALLAAYPCTLKFVAAGDVCASCMVAEVVSSAAASQNRRTVVALTNHVEALDVATLLLHVTAAPVHSSQWGRLVLCASSGAAALTLADKLVATRASVSARHGEGSNAPAVWLSRRVLVLVADLDLVSFHAISIAAGGGATATGGPTLVVGTASRAQPSKSCTSNLRRSTVVAAPPPRSKPLELLAAEEAATAAAQQQQNSASSPATRAARSYAHLMLPLLEAVWAQQMQRATTDVLLRDVFESVRGALGGVPTECLYSAFHALVSKGQLAPGYGREYGNQTFSKVVCWTCFPSNLVVSSVTTTPTTTATTAASSGGEAVRLSPQVSAWPEPTSSTPLPVIPSLLRAAPPPSMPLSPPPALDCSLPHGRRLQGAVDEHTPEDLARLIPAPLLREASGVEDPPTLLGHSNRQARNVVITAWATADHLLDTFPLSVCTVRARRQWRPVELMLAQQNNQADLLRVAVPLLTLQRQHRIVGVDADSLVQRCSMLDRMVHMITGGDALLAQSAGRGGTAAGGTQQVQLLHGAVGESTVRHLELMMLRYRSLARLSDGRLCFLSDVMCPQDDVVTPEELERASIDPAAQSGHTAPEELSNTFVRSSMARFLFARALREEQRLAFPLVAVRLRAVRLRWHELCIRHQVVPSVPLWEQVRSELEAAKLVHAFTAKSMRHTSVMFWTDLMKVALSARDMSSSSSPTFPLAPQTAASASTTECEDGSGWDEPYLASRLGDQRLCFAASYELAKVHFHRDVQVCPAELLYATQQDSVQEHYLLVLHTLQTLLRSVVVDTVVCEYLLGRLLDSIGFDGPTQPPASASAALGDPTPAANKNGSGGPVVVLGRGSRVWLRISEARQLLAEHKLIYFSGADVALGSDFMFHVPLFETLPKQSRTDPLVQEPVELRHIAPVLDVGVRVLLEALMHMQRVWRRRRVPWHLLGSILVASQQVRRAGTVDDILMRAHSAGLIQVSPPTASDLVLIRQTCNGIRSGWSQLPHRPCPMVSFVSDEVVVATAPPSYVDTVTESDGVVLGDVKVPVATASTSSRTLNPLSAPFTLRPTAAQSTTAATNTSTAPAPDAAPSVAAKLLPPTAHAEVDSDSVFEQAVSQPSDSVAMLEQLTTPTAARSHAVLGVDGGTPSKSAAATANAAIPLSTLSHRRRVVHRRGEKPSSSVSVLSQLFQTLERLEGKPLTGAADTEDQTSCGSSTRAATPAASTHPREPTPLPMTPTSSGAAAGGRFISALTWLFESALEDVARATPQGSTVSHEQIRRRKLYYTTLATFFETAASGDGDMNEDDADDDAGDDEEAQSDPSEVDEGGDSEHDPQRKGRRHSDPSLFHGIVIPGRNRPQLSHEQKRAIRHLHAELAREAMRTDRPDAEPWESVGFFFAKAEAIAGIK